MSKDDFFAKCATVNKWVFEIVERTTVRSPPSTAWA
jgi:hypothetical protein